MGLTNNLGKLSNMITSTGSAVGIGTSSPARTLSVLGTIGFYNNTGSNDSQLLQYNDGSLSVIASTYGSTGAYTPLTFKTSDVERMRVTNGGYVGVNCIPNAQFEVLGSTGGALTDGIRVSRNTLQSSQYGVINYTSGILNLTGVNTSGGGEIRFNTSDGTTTNERVRITSAGLVGMGTSNPNSLLDLYLTSVGTYFRGGSDNTARQLKISSSTTTNAGDTHTIDAQSGTGNLVFAVTSTERMRITSGGSVGIGTSSPSYPLTVYKNAATDATVGICNTVDTNYVNVGKQGSSAYGATSAGDAFFYNYGNNLSIMADGPSSIIKFSAGGNTERMRISNNSYGTLLAIGTTSPTNGGSAASWLTLNGTTAGTYSGGLAFAYNSAAKAYQFWDNNNFYVQNGALGVYLARDASSWSSVSDERLKDITGSIDNAVEKLMTLRAVNFSWKSDETNKENLGLIAQDVEKVFPQVVDKNKLSIGVNNNTDDNEYLGVRYQDLVPVLVKAMQEQQQEINELKSLIK